MKKWIALITIAILLAFVASVHGQGVSIVGTTSNSFKLNFGNTGPGVSQYIYFERGSSGVDSYFRWDENDDSFILSHPIASLTSRGKIVSNNVITFNDTDTSPTVGDGNGFKAANTVPTTIAAFDNGTLGQTIIVIFTTGNTTIDFTGTNLIGNGGSDWTPLANDIMLATYDGTDWYCDVGGGAGGGDATTLNGLDSSQFLRSDTSDSFSSGTLSINDGTILDVAGVLKLTDTDDSHRVSVIWNENDVANRVLNLALGAGDRSLILNNDFSIGAGYGGTLTYSAASKTLVVEADSTINQDLTTDASVGFAGLTLTGKLVQKSTSFADTDATPSVSGANVFKTTNTLPTTITDFGSGVAGQCIVVIVNDANTAFDFSSTNLKGNDNVDWNPNQYDTLFATYDGTYWWCDITITTSDLSSGSTTGNTLVKCDATAGSYTYAVPTAVGKSNEMYSIIKIDASTNVVTVDPNGSETMNGASTYRLERRYQGINLISDGANWSIASKTPRIINVKDFGATGNGVTDDYTAIMAAYAACAARDTLYFPTGTYIINHGTPYSLIFTQAINICGEGKGSIIYQKNDYDTIVYTGAMEFITVRDIYLKSDATSSGCASLDLTRIGNSIFSNIMFSGGYYGVDAKGCLTNTWYNLRSDSGVAVTNEIQLLVRLTTSTVKSNGNVFINLQARGGVDVCDAGLYFDGGGEGDITIIGSHFEGNTGSSIEILNSISGVYIESCHFEGNTATYGIKMTNSGQISIKSVYMVGALMTNVYLTGCYNIEIANSYLGGNVGSVVTDITTSNITLSNILYQNAFDIAASNVTVLNVIDNGGKIANRSGIKTSTDMNLVDGDLEVWTSAPLPIGFSRWNTNYPNKESTIKKFGNYSAKITVGVGQTTEGLYVSLSSTWVTALRGQYITASAWFYQPSTSGTIGYIFAHQYPDDSYKPNLAFSNNVTDTWVRAIYSIKVPTNTTSLNFFFGAYSSSAGKIVYADGIEIVLGNQASQLFNGGGVASPSVFNSNFRVGGNILRSSVVSSMAGNETFTWGLAEIYIKDANGASRTFNPSGAFPQGAMVHIINTNASYNISFDSTVLNYTISPTKGGIFVYTGTAWKTLAVY